jgi:hypothetical protein
MKILATALILTASIVWPSGSKAQCSSNCSVGAFGTGGENSGGRAQGFLEVGPGPREGYDLFNSGNFDAGHFAVEFEGDLVGTHSGTYRDGICRGLETGILGDDQGLDPDC